MKQVRQAIIVLSTAAILMLAATALAQTSDVDWKLYGGADVSGKAACFYDAKGLTHNADGHVKVWTKCLPDKAMKSIDLQKEFDGKIIEYTAAKIVHAYVPPYATMMSITNSDRIMDFIIDEEIADIADIPPDSQIFYELNCTDRMGRELSISIHADGKYGSVNHPREWWYAAPETNGAFLLKLLCPVP